MVQPAALMQFAQVDHEHVARKRRAAHVRRVTRADAAEREDLPQALAGVGQPVDEAVRVGAEIARTVRAGQ